MPAEYDTDFYGWTFDQARKLRAGEPVDVEHIAEELETLGRAQEQQLTSRLAALLQYLLKRDQSPREKATIREQRRRVNRLLTENPSLRRKLDGSIRDAYQTAVTFASVDAGIAEQEFPAECPFALDYLLEATSRRP